MSDILNDGSVVAGSVDVTINAVVYAASNWNWDEDATVVLRRDKNNKPSGRKVVIGEQTGTATLQLATTSTAMPALNVTFTAPDIDGSNVTCYLTKRGKKQVNSGETTVDVSFCKAIGSVTTS